MILVPTWHSMIWDGGDWQAINSQWPSCDDDQHHCEGFKNLFLQSGRDYNFLPKKSNFFVCSLTRFFLDYIPNIHTSRLGQQMYMSRKISGPLQNSSHKFYSCFILGFKLNLWSWKVREVGGWGGKVVASIQDLFFSLIKSEYSSPNHCLVWW